MKFYVPRWRRPVFHWSHAQTMLCAQLFVVIVIVGVGVFIASIFQGRNTMLQVQKTQAEVEIGRLMDEIQKVRSEDQFVRNDQLAGEIKNIQITYEQMVTAYEELLDLRAITRDTGKLEERLAQSFHVLSQREWASASAQLVTLRKDIILTKEKIASSFVIPVNVAESNIPPSGGFSRQVVKVDIGNYLVDIVAADMGTTKVIVDTASDGACMKDCPVMALSDYVSRSGAFAGINGSYFCPADYPSCAEKKNSFDTLLMNKNKVYFNSDNNVYSVVPAAIFLSGSMRFVGQSLEWGRDTSPDGVIANQPLLVSGGSVVFGGDGDPKKGSKGNRSFIGNKGVLAYIGVVHNATVAESAIVLKALGLDNALNLDSGGSTALWSGGYKMGPGRNIPNAILFVRK